MFAAPPVAAHERRYMANSVDSPLLSLPAEVRNRIWRYVLCDHVIHVGDPKRPHSDNHYTPGLSICKSAMTTADEIAIIKSHGCSSTPQKNHEHCQPHRYIPEGQDPSHGLQVCPCEPIKFHTALLQTCRQIHSEACLLPFTDNEFRFGSWTNPESPSRTLRRFVQLLVREQARAIKRIIIVRSCLTSALGGRCADDQKFLVSNLSGLEELTHIVCFAGDMVARTFMADGHRAEYARDESERQAYDALALAHLPLKNVTVAAYNGMPMDRFEMYFTVPIGVLRAWERHVEGVVLNHRQLKDGDDALI
jgi:hypothetical protein